jgi:hypothetical protein
MITAGPGRTPRVTVAAVFIGAVVALVFVIVGAHVTPSGHAHRVGGHYHLGAGAVSEQPPTGSAASRPALRPNVATDVAGIMAVLVGAVFVIGVLLILYTLLRASGRSRRRRSLPAAELGDEQVADDAEQVVAQMSSAVDEALDALGTDRPVSDAIILCWQRLGTAAAQAGIAPVASDTPEEAINRVFAAAAVRAGPLRSLAALYREARFSRHALNAADSAAARAALTAILDDLRQGSRAPT